MNEALMRPLPKKLRLGILGIVLLVVCLCVTTYALNAPSVSAPDQYFQTGTVSINLNDGNPVITAEEFLFEPGMTVTKSFFVKNESTTDVYYRLYLEEIRGYLATVLNITISDGEQTLLSGTAAELSPENASESLGVLRRGEQRELTITFRYPPFSGNAGQDAALSFQLAAQAVQTANNPDGLFD